MRLKAYYGKNGNLRKHPAIENDLINLTTEEKRLVSNFLINKVKCTGKKELTDDELEFINENFNSNELFKYQTSAVFKHPFFYYIKHPIFIIFTVVFVGYYAFSFRNKKIKATQSEISRNSPNYEDGSNLKTQSDLNKYALLEAEQLCKNWSDWDMKKNEENRIRGKQTVEAAALSFQMYTLRAVIRNNDMPDSYFDAANEIFDKKLKECGVDGY